MTDEELENSKDEIHDLFAEDLGGEPEDYRADRTAADGSGDQ